MATITTLVMFPDNDQVIEISGLQDGISSAFKNAATVTATLKDPSGAIVAGVSGLALSYVAGSNGIYRGTVQETFNPTLGGNYTLEIDASEGGAVLHLEVPTIIETRME